VVLKHVRRSPANGSVRCRCSFDYRLTAKQPSWRSFNTLFFTMCISRSTNNNEKMNRWQYDVLISSRLPAFHITSQFIWSCMTNFHVCFVIHVASRLNFNFAFNYFLLSEFSVFFENFLSLYFLNMFIDDLDYTYFFCDFEIIF